MMYSRVQQWYLNLRHLIRIKLPTQEEIQGLNCKPIQLPARSSTLKENLLLTRWQANVIPHCSKDTYTYICRWVQPTPCSQTFINYVEYGSKFVKERRWGKRSRWHMLSKPVSIGDSLSVSLIQTEPLDRIWKSRVTIILFKIDIFSCCFMLLKVRGFFACIFYFLKIIIM